MTLAQNRPRRKRGLAASPLYQQHLGCKIFQAHRRIVACIYAHVLDERSSWPIQIAVSVPMCVPAAVV